MNLPQHDVLDVIDKIRELKQKVPEDEALRHELREAIQELSLVLETPLETVRRIYFSPLQITIAKVANNLGIFDLLSRQGSIMSIDDLSLATKAERSLLTRVLRYLAAVGMVAEGPEARYSATKITRTLSEPGFKAGLDHHFDTQLPSWLALPSFLASTAYADPSDPSHTSFQVAHNTTIPAFEWAATRPGIMRDFAMWMSAQRIGKRSWLDVFPLELLEDDEGDPGTALFVDVGGGIGHQCLALKARIPGPTRRVILQDLPMVLARAEPAAGVDHMAHDFWAEQPVREASYYYLRNVLHDHPDMACVTLLRNIRAAMSYKSAILIDEIVLPDVGAQWQAAQLDIGMMASLAGRERSKGDWKRVVEEAGLRIKDIIAYDEEVGDSIIVVVLP